MTQCGSSQIRLGQTRADQTRQGRTRHNKRMPKKIRTTNSHMSDSDMCDIRFWFFGRAYNPPTKIKWNLPQPESGWGRLILYICWLCSVRRQCCSPALLGCCLSTSSLLWHIFVDSSKQLRNSWAAAVHQREHTAHYSFLPASGGFLFVTFWPILYVSNWERQEKS